MRWIQFILLVGSTVQYSAQFQSCPSVCTCKWKNGKYQIALEFKSLRKRKSNLNAGQYS